jgi:hypothetical protein
LFTDPAMHGPSKIAGETHFVLDLRSVSDVTMNAVATEARRAAARIGEAYRVAFDLGATSDSPPAVMDSRLRASLMGLLERPFEMPSGVPRHGSRGEARAGSGQSRSDHRGQCDGNGGGARLGAHAAQTEKDHLCELRRGV